MTQHEKPTEKLLTVRRPRLQRKLRMLLARTGVTEMVVTGDDGTRYYVSVWPPS